MKLVGPCYLRSFSCLNIRAKAMKASREKLISGLGSSTSIYRAVFSVGQKLADPLN